MSMKRVGSAVVAFAVATVIFLAAGLEAQAYLLGLLAAVVVLLLPAGTVLWGQKTSRTE